MTTQNESGKVSRRKFLTGTVGGLALGALAGYAGGISSVSPPQISPQQITTTQTATLSPRIKAGWIYVGPVGDFGWSYSHDRGRLYVQQSMPWLDTVYAESVPETEVGASIDQMVAQGCDTVFTTSFGYMDPTIAAGQKYPKNAFWHCSGYKRSSNVGTYYAEFYQLFYLCGLAAGAVNKTGKIGFVAAEPIPEVIRMINAFVLGAREVNPKIECSVAWMFVWYDPGKARDAATSLVESNNADVLGYIEDSATTITVAEEYQEKGRPVWSFSSYSDMTSYGPKAHLTGQLAEWGPLYEYILSKRYAGTLTSEDIWSRIGDGIGYRWRLPSQATTAVEADATFQVVPGVTDHYLSPVHLAPLNPVIPDSYKALIYERYEQMKELLFEPFTGPIKDQDGNLKLQAGQRASHDDLWNMDWFVEGITSKIPSTGS